MMQFLTWNPAVSSNRVTNFWVGFAYCVSTTRGVPPAPTLSGTIATCKRWHVVASGNTCDTLEAQYGITHSQFLTWNPAVSSNCATNFWAGYAYCVGLTAAPTTTSSTSRYGLTRAQFIAMNPSLSQDCSVGFWSGYAYCVRLGPPVTITTSSSSLRTTSTTSTTSSTSTSWFNSTYSIQHPTTSWSIATPTRANNTWPPTQTQAGQPSFCNYWHLVRAGEDCRDIIRRYADEQFMNPIDFYAWNPAVQEDCSGLYIKHWVCVGVDVQEEPLIELPYNETASESAGPTSLPPYTIPTATPLPTINPNWEPTPIHGTPPSNCKYYYQARGNDTCETVLAEFKGITPSEFFSWNTVLNNDCNGLWANYYYCAGAYDAEEEEPLLPWAVTVEPSPLASGTASNCVMWYQAFDGEPCWAYPALFGTFSMSEFLAWNPSVTGPDCGNFTDGYWYCVAVPDTPTTRTAPLPTNPWTNGPTATSSVATASITSASSSAPASTTSAAAVSTPQPIQAPMIAGCRRFYFVQPGEGCWAISDAAGISVDDFYLYNPAAAPDCGSMWSQIFVCVGISGPVATFSKTPPLPVPTN
ncbi:LysM domain-containing protein [Rhypophila decipiens]|uniref:LysM domain-containing protein n=1 Tax=Rhypophila decipiens TaxID=261697 RepID=A0AAN7B3F6_9PEZI|nr:LysM domain-containing protein [Rhypophila decipiens]